MSSHLDNYMQFWATLSKKYIVESEKHTRPTRMTKGLDMRNK